MSTSHDDPAYPFATFLAAFNSVDAEAIETAYEPAAVLVPRPGHPVTGQGRVAANAHLLGFGLPMEASLRRVYVADDIGLLIVDWSVRGTTSDGTRVDLAGSAADVVRRGADGWRYVIDNPAGCG